MTIPNTALLHSNAKGGRSLLRRLATAAGILCSIAIASHRFRRRIGPRVPSRLSCLTAQAV